MKIFTKVFGCKLNNAMAGKINKSFKNDGHIFVNDAEKADIIHISGCIVTKDAENELKRYANKTTKDFKGKKIILSGCVPEYLIDDSMEHIKNDISIMDNFGISTRTRREIIIQTGCNNFCSYCIVPYYRGKETSRSPESIVDEIRYCINDGAKEIVLTGVHIGKYMFNGVDFKDLLNILVKENIERMRLSSLNIDEIDEEMLELFSNEKIADYFHLSLQHTEDDVLKKMKRKYGKSDILSIVKKIKRISPYSQIGADIIIGFPYETENDFDKMLETLKNLEITHYHIFSYSKRDKAISSYFNNEVNHLEMKSRYESMKNLTDKKKLEYLKSVKGIKERMIIENCKNGYFQGTTGNYLKVYLKKKPELKKGDIVDIIIDELKGDKLFAEYE